MNVKLSLAAACALALSGSIVHAQTAPQSSPPTTTMPSNPANTSPTDPNATRAATVPTIPPQPVPPENNRAAPATPNTTTPVGATAQTTPQPPAFKDLDKNNDGSISRSESNADLSLSFSAYDTNGDGVLSPDEYARYQNDRAQLARAKQTNPPR